jgi:hypothetical protein
MGFYLFLVQKTNDSFENPSYRLILGAIVCQCHKMSEPYPEKWTHDFCTIKPFLLSTIWGALQMD